MLLTVVYHAEGFDVCWMLYLAVMYMIANCAVQTHPFSLVSQCLFNVCLCDRIVPSVGLHLISNEQGRGRSPSLSPGL